MPLSTIRTRLVTDLDRCVAALRVVHEADAYPLNWPADRRRVLRSHRLALLPHRGRRLDHRGRQTRQAAPLHPHQPAHLIRVYSVPRDIEVIDHHPTGAGGCHGRHRGPLGADAVLAHCLDACGDVLRRLGNGSETGS